MRLLTLALASAAGAETALTIYNDNLAVVRESVPIELRAGENEVRFDRATAQVQPDSVVLRDPAGQAAFSILEQSYRNDPVSRALLLSHFEGRSIDFRQTYPDGRIEVVDGKIVRSGYVPGGKNTDPIIEVEGKLRFQLPGEPLFPALGDGSILRPTLGWSIHAAEPVSFDAQLSYLSRGMTWEADYNLVAPEEGAIVTLAGWVTVSNRSGTSFDGAKVKLVAGDVNVVRPVMRSNVTEEVRFRLPEPASAEVKEKAFDDFHLYTLPRPLTIRDRETKQVEFLRSPEVRTAKRYVYDPAPSLRFQGRLHENPVQGQRFSTDVAVYWEFKNEEANGLGMPLPAGRVRFYREDSDDGNLEFVGENNIDHTPRNEELSIHTGNAFDLVGERRITDFQRREAETRIRESIEVTLKNRSKEPRTIVARERLWRWSDWKIEDPSMDFEKKDAQTIEFTVELQPDEEKKLSYTAHYTW